MFHGLLKAPDPIVLPMCRADQEHGQDELENAYTVAPKEATAKRVQVASAASDIRPDSAIVT